MTISKREILKGLPVIMAMVGAMMITVAIAADRLGLGGKPGFGLKQALLALAGFVVLLVGAALRTETGQVWVQRLEFKKLSQYYKASALMLLNTCVLFLLLNVGLYIVFQIKDHFFDIEESNPVSRKYSNSSLKEVYPLLSEEEIDDLLTETWSRPYVYEPFTQIKERPYSGDYVNVDENGFRVTKNQGPWPPDSDNFNIFLFGGSTVFGYGVPDDQTVASYLQEVLSNRLECTVRVYNFGRGFYYSSQERILLEKLLVSGFVPDMAIFVDGINEFYTVNDEPHFTNRLEQFFDSGQSAICMEQTNLESKLLKKLPMTRAARSLKNRVGKILTGNSGTTLADKQEEVSFDEGIYNDEYIITSVVDRYLENKRLVEAMAAAYSIQPVFVWQPAPTYKYDLNYHLFTKGGFNSHSYSRYGYQYMAEFVKEKPLGDNFLWCADMQEQLQEPLYVDKVHYSAKMSNMLAVNVANLLLERNLLVTEAR